MNNIKKLANNLPDNVDGALITSNVNRYYFTNFSSSSGFLIITKQEAVFITDFRYIEAAKKQIKNAKCVMFEQLSTTLRKQLKDLNISSILVEDENMSCAQRTKLSEILADVDLVDKELDKIIADLRIVKDEYEIDCINTAQQITDYGFEKIIKYIKPGLTEKEIALELEFVMRKQGAQGVAFDFIVVSGVNSSLPHGAPTDKVINHGDFITMDFGALYKGYNSDMTRTVAVGSCSEYQKEIYDIVLNAQLSALSAIKAGRFCREVDAKARDIIANAGYKDNFGHGTGHGVGLEVHEAPMLSAHAGDQVLQSANVVTVEPGIYLDDEFGVRIEDLVVVTQQGCKNLTKSPKELMIL